MASLLIIVMSCFIPRSTTPFFLLSPSFYIPLLFPYYSLPFLPCPGLLSPVLGMPFSPSSAAHIMFWKITLYLFGFGICFTFEPHFSTQLWISVCKIIIVT
jgi:hypothetical protein